LIFAIFTLIGIALVVRLGYIQIVQHQQFLARAEQQYGITRDIPAVRGTIKSADGFELASTQPAYLIYPEPKRIQDSQNVAQVLVDILNQPSADQAAAPSQTKSADPESKPVQTAYSVAHIKQLLDLKKRDWVAIAR